MNLIDMSIENMTNMSRLLFAISGLFAVSAVVMFFVLDIAKCWQMVSGKCIARKEKRQRANVIAVGDSTETEKLGQLAETVLLDSAKGEDTELLDTSSLEMIQDIVYVQNAIKIE